MATRSQEVDAARVLRVDCHRRHSGPVHPYLRGAGLQNPDRFDGGKPAHRRPSARQQVHLRSGCLLAGAHPAPSGHREARRCRGVQVSEEPDRDFIKRVIGLPGETVEVREKKVYINGKPLDEPFVHFLQPAAAPSEIHEITSFDVRERYGPVTVPPNQYFVMGDNRDNSQDSRYWGFLPSDYIKGRALIIYWSYQAERDDYQEGGAGSTLKGLGSVFVHFFTRTRWDRMFHQIR